MLAPVRLRQSLTRNRSLTPMVQFFAGVAVYSETINFGSVADWFTGLLTAGTLFLAVWILRSDRKRARRAIADSLVTWVATTTRGGGDDDEEVIMTVFARNVGEHPIPNAYVAVPPHHRVRGVHPMKLTDKGQIPVEPGDRIETRLALDPATPDLPVFIRFRDSRGQTWTRDVRTNKYVSDRRWDRLLKHYGMQFQEWIQASSSQRSSRQRENR